MSIFSKEKDNTGRQREIDITKAICIFLMILTHTFIDINEASSIAQGTLNNFIAVKLCNVFGASAFMICMGIGFGYSKNINNPNAYIKRGINIFIMSYVLNILRSLVIIFVELPLHYGYIEFNEAAIAILNVDIMQFAGLALILFGLLLKFKIKPFTMFVIGFGLSVVSTFVPYFTTNNAMIDLLLGTLLPNQCCIGDEVYSCFPLISYMIYPLFGYLYCDLQKRLKNKTKYYSIVTPICGIITIAFIIYFNKTGSPYFTDLGYYHPTFYYCLINIISTILLFGICYFLSLLLPEILQKYMTFTSFAINTIYCVHWVILRNLKSILTINNSFNKPEVPDSQALIIGITIYIVAVVITSIYKKMKTKEIKPV